MPFDFDPLSLDFPALTLQCLQPPPTLFSSTQHPTSTSWSVQSPGQREFEALQTWFAGQFKAWKVTCAAATTAVMDEFKYPPTANSFRNPRESVRKAEKAAEQLEGQVDEHLQSAYAVWGTLPIQRQQELWILELARGVGRKHKEAEKMKEQQHRLKQENANLKSQIEQLNKLQQPKEFRLAPPITIPMERELLALSYEQAVKGGRAVGFSLEDSQVDLSTLVSRSIERWKSVIASSRANANGMNAQRSLDQSSQASSTAVNGTQSTPQIQTPSQPQFQAQQQQQQQQQQQRPQLTKRLSTTSVNGATSEHATASTATTDPSSTAENSDQDADAEMEDDDSFAMVNPSPIKPQQPIQQQASLEVPRTRPVQQQQQQRNAQFMMPNGAGSPINRAAINLSRSMPNMNMAMQNGGMHGGDIAMAMQGVRGDAMYLE
jgi:F0F1-type ATP synthase membrane subunit b/b'